MSKTRPRCYGLFDTAHPGWLGDDKGPILWRDPELAACARTIHAIQKGVPVTTWIVKRFRERGPLTFNQGVYNNVMDGAKAIRIAEGEAPHA